MRVFANVTLVNRLKDKSYDPVQVMYWVCGRTPFGVTRIAENWYHGEDGIHLANKMLDLSPSLVTGAWVTNNEVMAIQKWFPTDAEIGHLIDGFGVEVHCKAWYHE